MEPSPFPGLVFINSLHKLTNYPPLQQLSGYECAKSVGLIPYLS